MRSEPFFFGPSESRLFGCYHPPAGGGRRRAGVLLCSGVGHEYMAAHRTVRQAALRLTRAGAPVLRFDYYGSGDSAGDSSDGRPSRWMRDIPMAAAELRCRGGVSGLALVGIRLGATMAHLMLAQADAEARALVLWDPVIDGPTYVSEVMALHAARFGSGDDDQVFGFPFTPDLRAELAPIDLMTAGPPHARDVLVVETGPAQDRMRGFVERLRRLGAAVEHRSVPQPPLWDDPGKSAVAIGVIQSIAPWLAARL